MINTGLKGKNVIVTSVNHGIGAAIAVTFASEEARVLISYLRQYPELYGETGTAWGIMVVDDATKAKVETVRLRVKKGIVERFKAVSFHDSQQVKCLPHDEAEVCFEVSGAGEMIPWLMSWGATLQVVEPQWLKDMMVKSLKETMEAC